MGYRDPYDLRILSRPETSSLLPTGSVEVVWESTREGVGFYAPLLIDLLAGVGHQDPVELEWHLDPFGCGLVADWIEDRWTDILPSLVAVWYGSQRRKGRYLKAAVSELRSTFRGEHWKQLKPSDYQIPLST